MELVKDEVQGQSFQHSQPIPCAPLVSQPGQRGKSCSRFRLIRLRGILIEEHLQLFVTRASGTEILLSSALTVLYQSGVIRSCYLVFRPQNCLGHHKYWPLPPSSAKIPRSLPQSPRKEPRPPPPNPVDMILKGSWFPVKPEKKKRQSRLSNPLNTITTCCIYTVKLAVCTVWPTLAQPPFRTPQNLRFQTKRTRYKILALQQLRVTVASNSYQFHLIIKQIICFVQKYHLYH